MTDDIGIKDKIDIYVSINTDPGNKTPEQLDATIEVCELMKEATQEIEKLEKLVNELSDKSTKLADRCSEYKTMYHKADGIADAFKDFSMELVKEYKYA